jgi:hypothetical protein
MLFFGPNSYYPDHPRQGGTMIKTAITTQLSLDRYGASITHQQIVADGVNTTRMAKKLEWF